MAAADVWNLLNSTLNFDGNRQGPVGADELELCVSVVTEHQLKEFTSELLWNRIFKDLRASICPKFWTLLVPGDDSTLVWNKFAKAVRFLHQSLACHAPHLEFLDQINPLQQAKLDSFGVYKNHLSSILLSQIPRDFETSVIGFYTQAFQSFLHAEKKLLGSFDADESGDVVTQCSGCDQEIDQCRCTSILNECHEINKILSKLGILEKITVGVIHSLLLGQIQAHVNDSCVGNFASFQIEMLEKWMDSIIFKWLETVYGSAYVRQEQVRRNLMQFLYYAYTQARIQQLFEIIIGYPESYPSVKDLNECLARTQLKPVLAQSLKATLESRLLHQGATTEDILIAYVSAIRAFSVLDPSGVLLDVACHPIKQYLRRRPDTVRHILHSLTDSSGELGGELELDTGSVTGGLEGDSLHSASNGTRQSEEPASSSSCWESWMPAPSDADPNQIRIWSGSKKQSEIVPMLVSIYGSKSLFVKEYRKLLSDRLLLNLHFDTEEEIRNLEFLKIRFGESELHNCEVMLKDVADSKRINSHIQSLSCQANSPTAEFPISALVISAQYWDQLKDKPMKLPEKILNELSKYNQSYQTVKASRFLQWAPQCGSVDLELEFNEGRTVAFTVAPDLAAIIHHFQEKEEWTLEELSREMELPLSHLRRRVHVWQMQGVLQEVGTDRYQIDQHGPSFSGNGPKILLDTLTKAEEDEDEEEEEEEGGTGTKKDKEQDDALQVYWSYVVGMLTNLEALSVERIHQMLKMFTLQGSAGTECTLQQLKLFLDSKVKQQLLVFETGMYRLPKP